MAKVRKLEYYEIALTDKDVKEIELNGIIPAEGFDNVIYSPDVFIEFRKDKYMQLRLNMKIDHIKRDFKKTDDWMKKQIRDFKIEQIL